MAEKRTSKSAASAGSGKSGAKKRGAEAGAEAKKPRSAASGKAKNSASGASDRDQRVRDRAYEIWEQEGRPSGRERDHWERANREIGQ